MLKQTHNFNRITRWITSGQLLILVIAVLIKKITVSSRDTKLLNADGSIAHLTSWPNSGRASSAFLALLSSLTGSRALRNLAG